MDFKCLRIYHSVELIKKNNHVKLWSSIFTFFHKVQSLKINQILSKGIGTCNKMFVHYWINLWLFISLQMCTQFVVEVIAKLTM